MKRIGPLLTVLVVVVVGAVLFIANSRGNPANQQTATAAAASTALPTPGAGGAPASGATAGAAAAAQAGSSAAVSAAAPTAAQTVAKAPVVAQKAYAGRTSGNEMTIAVAVLNGRAVAYLCDGKKIEAWLEGTLSGSDLSLRSGNGSATVTGTVDDAKAFGTVAIGSRSYPFAAKAAVAPAGLYQGRADVKGVANKIGWIVLGDGSQTGIAQPANGEARPAPVLDPARLDAVTIDGVPVAVAVINGGDTVIG